MWLIKLILLYYYIILLYYIILVIKYLTSFTFKIANHKVIQNFNLHPSTRGVFLPPWLKKCKKQDNHLTQKKHFSGLFNYRYKLHSSRKKSNITSTTQVQETVKIVVRISFSHVYYTCTVFRHSYTGNKNLVSFRCFFMATAVAICTHKVITVSTRKKILLWT